MDKTLWGAIDRYAVSCGGDPSKSIGSTARQLAMAEVERALWLRESRLDVGEVCLVLSKIERVGLPTGCRRLMDRVHEGWEHAVEEARRYLQTEKCDAQGRSQD